MIFSRVTGAIFLAGAVVLGVGGFRFLSIPSQRQGIEAAQIQFSALQQKNKKLSEVLSEAKTIESNLALVRRALPAEDDVPALIMQLERIAKQSGVAVQHLGFGGSGSGSDGSDGSDASNASGDKVDKVPLTAVVTGSYNAFQTFLKNLEETSRIINVTNFRFSPAQQGGEEAAALSITLGVRAFYLTEAAGVSTEEPLTLDTGSREYVDLIKRVKVLR